MTGKMIREKLHRGECVVGTHVASLMNPLAASIAVEMDLDFAFFCTEHMPIDRTEAGHLCALHTARGISPIVRVPTCDESLIAMYLDGGAEGIVVPYVETVDQVQRAVGAVKYRPVKGRLLDDVLRDGRSLPPKTRDFLDRFNRDRYLIVGIESVKAMENLEDLIAVEGVDGVFLGPHDITVSMGIPEEYQNPAFVSAIEDVIRRCRRASVGVGLHTNLIQLDRAILHRYLHAGMNWLINGADVTLMRDTMNSQLRVLRGLAGAETIFEPSQTELNGIQTCIT